MEPEKKLITNDEAYLHFEELLLADGFEGAFLGIAERFGWSQPVAAYDLERCIEIMMERVGMSREGAQEFFSYNVIGAWVGAATPIFITGMSLEAVHAAST